MAKHALDGDLSPFLWGQPYGGTLEAYMSAPLYGLFGPHKLTVELVPIVLSIAAVWVVWRIGKRVLGEPAATIAAALYWVWPAYALWKSTKAHGFYASGLLLGLLAVLLVVRLADDISLRDVSLLGLVLGIGWWMTPQILLYVVPLLAWIVVWRPRILRYLHLFAAGAALGALPWLVYNVRNDWFSLQGSVGTAGDVGSHLVGAFRNALPAILGLRVPWSQEWILTPWLGPAVGVALIAGFLWFWIGGRWGPKLQPLVLIALAYPFVFALSPQAGYVVEPRYFYFLVPVIVLLAVGAVREWRKWMFGAALGAAVLSSIVGLAYMRANHVTFQGAPDVQLPADVGLVVDLLEDEGVRHVYANYWLAHLVTYWSDEQIIGVEDAGRIRYEPYAAAAAEDPAAAHAFVEGTTSEAPYREGLEEAGTPYERHEVDGFVVYIPLP